MCVCVCVRARACVWRVLISFLPLRNVPITKVVYSRCVYVSGGDEAGGLSMTNTCAAHPRMLTIEAAGGEKIDQGRTYG